MSAEDIADAWAAFHEIQEEAKVEAGEEEPVDDCEFLTPCHKQLWIVDRLQGRYLCSACGYVSPMPVMENNYSFALEGRPPSSYKRMHHWNERISQWLCMETPLSRDQLAQIEVHFKAVPASRVTKVSIRACLRELKLRKYVEKWVAIRCHIVGSLPPDPDSSVITFLRRMFPHIEGAFEACKPPNRKSLICYNFVFVRLLQLINRPQYYKYFPLIKKSKLKGIDATWQRMTRLMGVPYMPLPRPRFFRFLDEDGRPNRRP